MKLVITMQDGDVREIPLQDIANIRYVYDNDSRFTLIHSRNSDDLYIDLISEYALSVIPEKRNVLQIREYVMVL